MQRMIYCMPCLGVAPLQFIWSFLALLWSLAVVVKCKCAVNKLRNLGPSGKNYLVQFGFKNTDTQLDEKIDECGPTF